MRTKFKIRFFNEFPIESYVELYSAVEVILVGIRGQWIKSEMDPPSEYSLKVFRGHPIEASGKFSVDLA